MPAAAPPIKFDIFAHDRTRAAFNGVQRRMRGLISSALRLTGITSGGLIAAQAVRDATTFQSELAKIVTLVGVAEEQVAAWKSELLELAPALGKSPVELAQGLFFITSAGLRGRDAIEALVASAKGAAIGLGDTATVADAATSAINAYAKSNLSGAQAVAVLAAGVREGKLEAESLAGSVGQVIPLASKLGVGIDQVVAAMAAMSRTGTNAAEAATQLNSIFSATLKPTTEAEEQLSRVGLTLAQVRDILRNDGLLAALQTLEERFQGNDAAMARAFGNIRALRGVFNLLGENVQETRRIFDTLANESAQNLEESFKKLERLDPGFRMRQSWERLNKELIKTADSVLPSVSDAFSFVLEKFNSLVRQITPPEELGMAELAAEAQLLEERLETLEGFGRRNSAAYEQLAHRLAAVRLQMEKLVDLDVFGEGGIPRAPSATDVAPAPAGGAGEFSTQTQKVIEALEFEAAQLGRTAKQQEIYNQLQRAGVDINSVAGQRIAMLAEQLFRAREQQQRMNETIGFFGGVAVDVLDRATQKGADLSDIFNDVASAIKRAALEAVLLGRGPLAGLFGTAPATPGGTGGLLGSLFAGFFDRGGFIPPGRFGIAGESGPEPVFGGRTGVTVIPSPARLGSAKRSAVSITFNVTTPDAGSFRQSESQIAAMLSRAVSRGERNL